MRDNLINFPTKMAQYNKPDDLYLIAEIQDLIYQFQDPNSSITTREEAFKKIIDLTNQLTS